MTADKVRKFAKNGFVIHVYTLLVYIFLGITDLLDFVHRPVCYGTQRFRPQVKGQDASSTLGPLERANLTQ
jgi:hypothetical protein